MSEGTLGTVFHPLIYLPPGSNSSTTPGQGVNTADVVGWVVFSLSTFLAIVTAVIMVVRSGGLSEEKEWENKNRCVSVLKLIH